MALWDRQTLAHDVGSPSHRTTPSPIVWGMNADPKPLCEVALPALWQHLSPHHDTITGVATLREPGPFTATRAGLSFAQGMSQGSGEWTWFSTSFFNLLSPEIRDVTLLDTGGHHWINASGALFSETHPSHHKISADTCTESLMLTWSEHLAILANRLSNNIPL